MEVVHSNQRQLAARWDISEATVDLHPKLSHFKG